MASDVLKMLVITIVMFVIDWKLALISYATMPLILYFTRWFQRSMNAAFVEVRKEVANLNAFVQERISGIKVVQLFAQEREELENFKKINEKHKQAWLKTIWYNSIFFPIGDPNDGFAQYFVGQSYLAPVSTEQVTIFNVTFEPGCRNNWHIHHALKGGGQMLIGVGGKGWYQEEGKPAQEILPGTVIHIPANVKHWHGAQKDSWFSHLAFEIEGENASNEWCEPVIDEEYLSL